ncbi:hypothetical protein FB567DRAFT_80928 [Paraphoma chrysanthemicola]|uniref:Uncharacterized protein n=1 Tax=Paraphoma chrysanthemicola TaxID=798071 RepID=A0A8K0R4V1_9PLEO|nr:hypothetical protein FB567DRAFT_80928 [Paraphoma chrysanthemicola]
MSGTNRAPPSYSRLPLRRSNSFRSSVECDGSRGEKTSMLLAKGHTMGLAKTNQVMTHIHPQWGNATITSRIAGDTDLAFAEPGTRFTPILCDRKACGRITDTIEDMSFPTPDFSPSFA